MALAAPVRADDLASGDAALDTLLDVQVESASRYAQSRFDAPSSVYIITREEAAALGHMTLGDMLQRLPGVQIAGDRDYSRIGVRGIDRPGDLGARLLVTVDGLRINDAIFDQALPQYEFPVVAEWIKRVEYLPGTGSSIYGSNALLGVVNAVTIDGADEPGLNLRTSLGSFGSRRLVANYGSGGGLDNDDVFIGLAAYRTDGEQLALPELGSAGNPLGLSPLRDTESYVGLLLKARHDAWRVLVTGTMREQDIATAPAGTVFGVPGTHYRDQSLYAELAWDNGWAGDLRPSARVHWGYSGFLADYLYAGDTADAEPIVNVDDIRGTWWGTDTRVQWRGWTNHMVVTGIEARYIDNAHLVNEDRASGERFLDLRQSATTVGVYAQDEWRVSERVALTSGLRVDRLPVGGTRTSPRLALVLRPDGGQAVKFSIGQAFRSPNMIERFYNDGGIFQIANPSLRPERILSTQAAWESALGPSTLMTIAAYRHSLSDLIELVGLPGGLTQHRNVGTAESQGIEIELAHRAENDWQWRFSVSRQSARGGDQPLSSSPQWLGKAELISPTVHGWQIATEIDALSRRLGERAGPGMPARDLAGSVRWNSQLSFQPSATQRLAVRVVNAGNADTDDPVSAGNVLTRVPRPARTLWLDWRIAL